MKFPKIDWSKLWSSIRAFFVKPKAVDNPTVQEVKPPVAAPVETKPVEVPPTPAPESITDKLFPHAPIVASTPTPIGDLSNDTGPYGSSYTFTAIDGRGFRNVYKAGVETSHTVIAPRDGEMALDFAECPGVVKGGSLTLGVVGQGPAVTASPFTTDHQVRFTAVKGQSYVVLANYSYDDKEGKVVAKFDVSLKN
jgi:hypothetical protein